MAKGLIEIALQLGKQLGANTSKFLGTKSNVSFLGSGPKDGMLFQKSINPESFATIGIEKVLPDIESSLGYAVGGKLNDIQLNKLIDNMSIMADVLDPLAAKNVVDASSKFRGGLESLEGLGLKNLDNVRSKSGMAERQITDAASERPINRSGELTSVASEPGQSGMSYAIKNPAKIPGDESAAFPSFKTTENIDTSSPLMSKLENRIGGMRDETEAATGIMANVAKGDLPGKTGAAREFLVNSLKVGDDYPSTTLTDVMSAQDMKFVMEGGGGAMGDPLVLVQKYFGPRIAEMIPNGGTPEEIAIFTKKVLENVEDAKGLRPDEPAFDPLTARFVDELADGGIAGLETRQGLKFGGKTGKSILAKIDDKMIKKAADDIFPTDDYKYDAELVVDALVENNPKLFKNLLADDLDDALRSELYGLAVSETGTRAAMKIKAGKMERPLFDENGNLNKDAVLADATKFSGLDGRKDAVKRGIVNENVPEFKRESMKLVDGETSKGEKFKTFETTTAPRMFTLNVEKAVSELNIPREEAIRIASLPSDQQKIALQIYLDKNMAQRAELMNYNPKTFDAAKGGRAGYSKGGLAKFWSCNGYLQQTEKN